ncbi:RsmE family RNA methyltransferase [Williamsoniiplasma lucivorax]|uniref:Ribosomal RNA small subunit methyltransferase E n=1 Tax=Williamsoniiplasma lucivorax TaxID=209274 RepID=A0A2S5RFN2_9MOLU|nr:16S rRNA (uracil(1498)-N(3))-methyltransferase [Williamsoniiplasma lucivorax]PPE06110.1 16S ribosomal RNA methyltransferase RsmE [Williamsoniiplasma lucivorax]
MHYYFVNEITNNNFILKNENFKHAANVVKLKVGEEIVCNYHEQSFLCEIVLIATDHLIAQQLKQLPSTEAPIKTIAILGIIREQKWDFVLQKLTELGVHAIVPTIFKRSVVKVEPKAIEKKILRWTKICEDAAEQSHRSVVPIIHKPIINLQELEQYKSELNLVLWEDAHQKPLKSTLNSQFRSLSFIVGPEGGIEQKEIEILATLGFETVSLGQRILRAETASIALLSALNYEKEW